MNTTSMGVSDGSKAFMATPVQRPALPSAPTIGVVVPVYNEAAILSRSLERLRATLEGEPVVVVDAGSRDGSAHIARRFFHTETEPEPNRGAQLNHGALCLSTDVLLFLHADSQLPAGFQALIRMALLDPDVVGGCFRLQFDVSRPLLRFYSWCTRFPGRFLHFGDQAFFMRREVFEKMGGYRRLPLLEDVDLLRRLRHQGRFVLLPVPVTTSARRFLRHGVLRQQLKNILVVALFELGISAERLAWLYPHAR
jgi:rSAM/selenodomain-associated transferase 2